MAIATDTTQGSVLMTGDLYGMGTEPQLRPTGVTPNEYVVPTLVVDQKGRVISAALADISMLCADETQCGVAKIGREIKYVGNEADLYVATTLVKGVVKAGSGVRAEDGIISAELPIATGSVLGLAKIGDGLEVDVDGVVTVLDPIVPPPIATESTVGAVKIGGGLSVDTNGVADLSGFTLPLATADVLGAVYVPAEGTGLSIDANGALSLQSATTSSFGIIQPLYGEMEIDGNGYLQPTLYRGTAVTLGCVKVNGGGFSVDGSGVLSYSGPPTATSYSLGGVKVPSSNGLSVDVNGALSYSPPTATTATAGMVIVPTSGNLAVDGSGNISVPLGTNSVFGVVKGSTDHVVPSNGVLYVAASVMRTNTNMTMSKTHYYATPSYYGSSSTPTVTIDLSVGGVVNLFLSDAVTISNPTNISSYSGLNFVLQVFAADTTTVTWGSSFLFPGGDSGLPTGRMYHYMFNCLVIEDKIYCTPSEME